MSVVERIEILLNGLGINQTDLMKALELNHTAIIHWRSVGRVPKSILQLIELKYGISPDWLRTGEGEMFNKEVPIKTLAGTKKKIATALLSPLIDETDAKDILKYITEKTELACLRQKTNTAETISRESSDINIGFINGGVNNKIEKVDVAIGTEAKRIN
jgi:hypothetical protein